MASQATNWVNVTLQSESLQSEVNATVFPKQLVRLSFARFLMDTLLLWGIALALLVSVHFVHTTLMMSLVFVANGVLQNAFGILSHDSLHYRVHNNKKVNDWFARFFVAGPITFPLTFGRLNHLNHHKYLGTQLDRDRHYYQTLGKETPQKVFGFFFKALFMFGFVDIAFKILLPKKQSTGSQTNGQNNVGFDFNILFDVLAILTVQVVIFTAYTLLTGSWLNYFFLWLLPLYTISVFLNTVRSFCEHAVPAPDEIADVNRMITHTSHPLELFIVAPFGMNYHTEHHLYMAVPYYHLPALYQWLKKNPPGMQVTYKKYYWQTITDFASTIKNKVIN